MEEQNQAYLESLRQDEEKERKRQKEHDEKARAEREIQERLRKEEEERQRELREAEEKKREAESRRLNVSQHIDDEPPMGDNITQLMIRLSDGTKIKRRFVKTDHLAVRPPFRFSSPPYANA